MIEVKIPKSIKIGGFDYKVVTGLETSRLLSDGDGAWGKCQNALLQILFDENMTPEQFANTFIHEILHAVTYVYMGGKCLNDEQITGLANGLHQIFEQLGVRFIVGDKDA